jgi:peptidoglycan/xylan/chitin deacetylase (PgdA/CDA1 family)
VEQVAISRQVLNLCFHGIGEPGRPMEPDEDQYWIGVEQFEAMLGVIVKHSHVRVTFDDGNASDAVIALPALRRRQLTATFFVLAGRLDEPGSLSSRDVRSLVDAGMKVGSHGMAHRSWRSVPDADLRDELDGAAAVLAGTTGQQIRELACPFGAYDRRVLREIRRLGFSRVYTVDGGSARPQAWLQSRYTVRRSDTPDGIDRLAAAPNGSVIQRCIRTGKTVAKRWR